MHGPEANTGRERDRKMKEPLEQHVIERTAASQVELPRLPVGESIEQQKELLQKIFDHIPVMINFLDKDGRIRMVNREWERTLGWTLEERNQLDILAECYPDPDDHQRALHFIRHASGEWADYKTRVRDGRTIDTTWCDIHLSDGTHIGIGQDITARKQAEAERARLFDEVRASHEQLEVLSRKLLRVHEAERRAVARELHDEIGQLLTGVSLILTNNQQRPRESSQARLAEAQSLIRTLIEQVRNLSLDLRPEMLDDLGLVPALTSLFERYTKRTSITVRFHNASTPQRFSPEIETTAYRIVQEALTNVARHAGVREVTVRVWSDAPMLCVTIEDRGRGFDPHAIGMSASSGFAGMRERVALLGGQLRIESAVGSGTRVMATLPLPTVDS
jgi:PAS domain S-box-containing protein